MTSKKNLSLFERIRLQLGMRPFEMARAFGHERQWYEWRKNSTCALTVSEFVELHRLSGLSAEEFLAECEKAAEVGAPKKRKSPK